MITPTSLQFSVGKLAAQNPNPPYFSLKRLMGLQSWRKLFQFSAALQRAAPATTKNTNKSKSDEAVITTSLPCAAWLKPPPVFVQNKDRWAELRKKCAEKNIQFSQARDSFQGLKLQAKTVADFRNLQNLLVTQGYAFHTYSLKEEREIRVVLRGVSRETHRGGQGRPPLSKSPGVVSTPYTETLSRAPRPGSGLLHSRDHFLQNKKRVLPLRNKSGAAPQTYLT
ncbi:Nucleic-acid-binding protein from transposon X-element [Eumeta japonica]|uniref:Nucleic-acid-binding protein from transposon X-element n=1 Tax=Eumeta variegata TaxID=151549 RepID=A0A4C1VF70_EUMVA|nr:Nucleic-acid-binding protein from transposon X-element [Eumeta japonica]